MEKNNSMKPLVSVVIPSFNAEKHIERCLTSLLQQHTTIPYEILVVDSSSDATPRLIAEKFPTVRLIRRKEQTYPGAGRNIGVQQAQGEIIAFIDTDCVADEKWLVRGVEAVKNSQSIIGGSIHNANPGGVSWSDYFLTFNEFMPTMPRREVQFMPTCNLFITKNAFEKIGGFREDLLAGEDTLFCYAAKNYGLLFEPKLQVSHFNRESLENFIGHHHNFGKHSAYVRKHANLSGKKMVQNPLLVLLAPAVRAGRISWRMIRYNWSFLPLFLLSSPFLFVGVIAWSSGFIKEAWKK